MGKEEVMKKIGMKLMCGLSTALRCIYGLFLGLTSCFVVYMVFIGTPFMLSKAIAAELQQKRLELPANYSMEDFKAALQLGWEFRITKGEIPKCSEAYRPAMQRAMEAARKCWNLDTCSKVVTDSAREAMGCPQKGVCDGKVDLEVLDKCNKKCTPHKDNETALSKCIAKFK